MLARARRHGDATALLGLLAVALVLTGPALFGDAALGPEVTLDADPLYQRARIPPPDPPFADQSSIGFHYPRDLAFAEGLRAGRIDHWNPMAGAGAPLWSEQSGPFFPLKLVFYAWPTPRGYTLFLTLRLLAAGIGAYLLARRRLGIGPAAFLAGALFEASGSLVAHLSFGGSSALYVLPWVIMGAQALVARPGWRAVAGAGLALGVAAHGGHPSLTLLVWLGFCVFVAAESVRVWRQPRCALRLAGSAGLALVLGGALAAPVLLPLAELRFAAISYKDSAAGSEMLRAHDLAGTRAAAPLAALTPGLLVDLGNEPQARLPWGMSASLGVLALALAAAGIAAGGLGVGALALAAVGLILALGPPGTSWVSRLPGAGLILPRYAWALVVLPAALAAGHGLQAFIAGQRRWPLLIGLALVMLATAALLVFGAPALLADAWTKALQNGRTVLMVLIPPLLALISVLFCLVLAPRVPTGVLGVAVALVATAEALTHIAPYTRQPASAVLRQPPSGLARLLHERLGTGDARMLALPIDVGLPQSNMLFGLPDFRSVAALPLRRYYAYLATAGSSGTITYLTTSKPRSALLDLAAVRYVALDRAPQGALIAARQELEADPAFSFVRQTPLVALFENRAALPRFRLVSRAIPVRNQSEARQKLAVAAGAPHAQTVGLDQLAYVEPDHRGQLPSTLASTPRLSDGVRLVNGADPDRLVIDVTTIEPALLVVADAYDPGWHATVDGTDTPVYPANLLFRGLFIPAGAHQVVMSYRPRTFPAGLALAGIAFLVGGAMLWRGTKAGGSGGKYT